MVLLSLCRVHSTMSTQHLKSSAGGLSLSYKFGRLDHREPENPDMGLQILSPSWERAEKLVAIQKPNARNGCILGLETRGSVLVFSGEAEEQKTQSLCAKSGGGHTKLCARGHWRPAEDAKLKDLVSRFGPQNWNLIAEHLQGRSGKSCRLRWFNQLDPRINRKAFNEEEEDRLLAAHKAYGNKWAMIARLFPGRTDNAVKNHWHVIMARRQREQSNVYRKRKPPSHLRHRPDQHDHQHAQALPKGLDPSSSTTLSSNVDESDSTCTDLSLTPSSAMSSPPFFSGSSGKKTAAVDNVTSDKSSLTRNGFHFPGPGVINPGGLDYHHQHHNSGSSSDSNSEVSAPESVAAPTTNSNKMSPPSFIDFLGVGST